MSSNLQFQKILWAVDAFQPLDGNLKNVAKHVQAFAKTFNAEVYLVFALSIPKLLMDEKCYKIFQQPYLEEAEKNISRFANLLKGVKVDTKVLTNAPRGKRKTEVQLILDEAKTSRCDAIAIATHAHNVVMKMFLGSFAESLLNMSPLPVLLIGPHQKAHVSGACQNLLYPTDFSKDSAQVFDSVLELAQKKNWQVHLVHGLINEYIPAVLSDAYLMGGFYPMNSDLFRDTSKEQETKLKSWLDKGLKKGVALSGEIDGRSGLISDLITKVAKGKKSDLIVMTTQAGKSAHDGMGSVTKKVVRKSDVPVLALKT